MSSKLSNDTVGKKLVDFYNPILGEVRDTFKNNSYEEIQRAYNLSDKEINVSPYSFASLCLSI